MGIAGSDLVSRLGWDDRKRWEEKGGLQVTRKTAQSGGCYSYVTAGVNSWSQRAPWPALAPWPARAPTSSCQRRAVIFPPRLAF